MNKAFVKETDDGSEDASSDNSAPALPKGEKNYMTPAGFDSMQNEFKRLLDIERPQVVETVHWAAANGDRSENGDYIYGKRRLREIDRRVRFLTKRLEIAQVVDPSVHYGKEQVFFGASVTYLRPSGDKQTVTIMGIDEADPLKGQVSWISPIARALLKAHVGDEVRLMTPAGVEMIEVLEVHYPEPR